VNLTSLVAKAEKTLREAGVPSPRVDAELIIAHVLKKSRTGLYLEARLELGEEQLDQIQRLIAQRVRRIPLQLLLGTCEFMGIEFQVRPGVFIPRPETEVVVEAATEALKDLGCTSPRMVDVGTGCGVIAIGLAKRLEACSIVATDISPVAVEIARQNAILNRVDSLVAFVVGDALEFVKPDCRQFDIVVSNPPYVRSSEIGDLEPEVKDHDPRAAIDGGPDGLRFFERIAPQAASLIRRDGLIVLEIGADQASEVGSILRRSGFGEIEIRKDLAGRDRVILGKRS